MPECDYFNGENFITFDLIEIDDDKREVTVAVSNTGRIRVKTFDLLFDGNRRYFEYGCLYTKNLHRRIYGGKLKCQEISILLSVLGVRTTNVTKER